MSPTEIAELRANIWLAVEREHQDGGPPGVETMLDPDQLNRRIDHDRWIALHSSEYREWRGPEVEKAVAWAWRRYGKELAHDT